MGQEISRSCELSCDEAVIHNISAAEKAAYGDTLLNVLEKYGSVKTTLTSITLNKSKELLKERLDAIMNYKKAPRKVFAYPYCVRSYYCAVLPLAEPMEHTPPLSLPIVR